VYIYSEVTTTADVIVTAEDIVTMSNHNDIVYVLRITAAVGVISYIVLVSLGSLLAYVCDMQ
jgi:hypothetical protein